MSKTQTTFRLESFVTFGELLRYLRERAHLTQRELAALVGYHYSYMSYIEKNTRVPDEASLLGRFVPALGLENEPEIVGRLLALATEKQKKLLIPTSVPMSEAESTASEANVHQLPTSLTSILGREREIASLKNILARVDVRIITIVGPPGVGKTRLALHVAGESEKKFADGVVFVNLTTVTQAELALPAIETALGNQKLSSLQKKNMLIVMDNFEQAVGAAPQLVSLLGNAPGVKIIATSREALRVRGEQEFPLAPLPVPDDSFLDSPAMQLFIERARAVKPDFTLDEKNAARVAEICRRLDGLPLAIELAAARVQTLSLSAMLEHFDRRFEWLARGGRDLPVWRQTLWGAVEWSYNLLSGQERALLNRLSVFADGWTLKAAEAICSDETLCAPSDILNLLMLLADKSLMIVDIEADRYQFLDTLREFAWQKLMESSEREFIQQRHGEYYLKFAQDTRPHLLQGGEQAYWLNQMEREHNNLRAALAWTIESPTRAANAMDFGWAMHTFWYTRSYIGEARRWLNQILALAPASSTATRADLLRYASDYASTQGDFDRARIFEEEGMAISKILGDEAGVYYSLDGLAMLAGMQGDYAQAANLLEQVLAYRRQTNDSLRLTATLNNLAIATRRLGNIERTQKLYTESIAVSKSAGNLKSLAHALNGLAEVYVELKEYDTAIRLQRESISIRHQLGDLKGVAVSLEALSISMEHLGDSLLATQLESASHKIRQELGLAIAPATRTENENFIAQLRVKLGDEIFENAWSSGQTMPLEQALNLALGTKDS